MQSNPKMQSKWQKNLVPKVKPNNFVSIVVSILNSQQMRPFFAGVLTLMLGGSTLSPCLAADDVVTMDARTAIDLGLERNKSLAAAKQQILQARADVDRVDGEFGPRIKLQAGVGPMTAATGNAVRSEVDTSDWGAIVLGSAEVTQPIYTFGRKADYANAAENGVRVKEVEYAKEQNQLRYQIKEAYYGLLYATTLQDFIQSGKEDLRNALKDIQKRKTSKDDLDKLEIFSATLDAKAAEVERAYKFARRGLTILTGTPDGKLAKPSDSWLDWEERESLPLAHYTSLAISNNPDLLRLAAGITAKNSLASAERKGAYPTVAMLLKFNYAHTKMRERQQSVFANDPYNDESLVFGVGISWDFQWGLASAKSSKHRAEVVELELQQDFAKNGIPALVEEAWLELKEAETKLAAAERGSKAGKRWLSRIMIGMSAGFKGDSQKLVEAYQARAATLKDYYEAVYKHHLAWAKLSRVVGKEVDPLFAEEASL